MALKIFPVQGSELPVSKDFQLGSESFEFRFLYNERFDFITVEIYQEGLFLFSSKLCYGSNILNGFTKSNYKILPLTEEDLYVDNFSDLKVNLDTLGKSVFLFYDDGVEE